MTDEHLKENLRRLPEAGAGEGFTRAVLARLAEETAGPEDTTTDAGSRRPGGWLGGFGLQGAGARLAAVAAVMVIAASLALTLLPAMGGAGPDQTARTDPMAAAAPNPEPEQGLDDAPVEPGPASDLATLPSTTDREAGGELGTGTNDTGAADTGAAGVAAVARDARPDATLSAATASTETGNSPDPAAPGAARTRGLDPEERRRAVERLRQLRREQERLRDRLAALTEAPAPTLVLGGDESLELVLDLNADAGPVGGGGGYGARPAGYRQEPEPRRYLN